MDKEMKKALKAQYAERHPDMGVVCWRSGGNIWAYVSRDAQKDYNSSLFQLRLGSWPNRELQSAYSADPNSFEWKLAEKLEYEDPAEDYSEELEILLLEFLEKYPQAKPMRPGKRFMR